MDEVRNQLWEYVWNISNYYVDKTYGWFLVYSWNVSYEWVDYAYNCKVLNKDKVKLELQEVSWNISGKIEVSKEVKSLDSNVIYWWKGKHEISWDETIYYNSWYWISLKVGKDFRWWVILESDTDQWDTSTDNRYTTHDINFLKLEDYKLWTYQPWFLITVFSNEETEKRKTASTWNKWREDSIIGMNNKYTFIWLPSSGDFYSDLYFFDVEESKSVVNVKEEKNSNKIIAPRIPNVDVITIHTWCNNYINNEFWFQINLDKWNNGCKIEYEEWFGENNDIIWRNIKLWSLPLNDYWWFETWGDFELIKIVPLEKKLSDFELGYSYLTENNKYKFYHVPWSASPSFYYTFLPLNYNDFICEGAHKDKDWNLVDNDWCYCSDDNSYWESININMPNPARDIWCVSQLLIKENFSVFDI